MMRSLSSSNFGEKNKEAPLKKLSLKQGLGPSKKQSFNQKLRLPRFSSKGSKIKQAARASSESFHNLGCFLDRPLTFICQEGEGINLGRNKEN